MPKDFQDNFRILSGDDFAKFKRCPIRHNELPPTLLKQLEGIYRDVAHLLWPTLEAWEVGFLFERYPEREVAVWRRIADAFLLYRRRHAGGSGLADDEGLALVAALLAISSGVGLVSDVRELEMVSEEDAHRLVACWRSLFGSDFTPVSIAKRS